MKKQIIKYNFCGIAFFGAPGSGKTIIAESLSRRLPQSVYLEAFKTIIVPAASIPKLPKNNKLFFRIFDKLKISIKNISRDKAREIFISLKNKYSPSIVAKTLEYIHQKKYLNRFIIISGTRGYENAEYLKRKGYFIVFLKISKQAAVKRLTRREYYSKKEAENDYDIESNMYQNKKTENIADLILDTTKIGKEKTVRQIIQNMRFQECKKCVNNTKNPTITINKAGLCNICEWYGKNFNKRNFVRELKFLKSFIGKGEGKHDVMVGISGGKDSTATLYTVKQLGFAPLAFTFDIGYYPQDMLTRAKQVAKKINTDHKIVPIQKYIKKYNLISYRKIAKLYDEKNSEKLQKKFLKLYGEGRKHYSVKHKRPFTFVRTCQLCRRTVIPAYYAESLKYGVRLIVLGINEWAGLSKSESSKKHSISAIRKLKPFLNKPAVYIVHLPFLLQRNIKDTEKILKKLGWKLPPKEELIESNSNSCLLARAAENKAGKMLGFHPDSTRLAREAAVGFITKKEAQKALDKVHNYKYSVREVLKRAKII